jgi:hypothetical protein
VVVDVVAVICGRVWVRWRMRDLLAQAETAANAAAER